MVFLSLKYLVLYLIGSTSHAKQGLKVFLLYLLPKELVEILGAKEEALEELLAVTVNKVNMDLLGPTLGITLARSVDSLVHLLVEGMVDSSGLRGQEQGGIRM